MTPLLMSKSRADQPASSVSQSSAMMPLTWHLGIFVAGTVGAAAVGAPTWLLGLLGGLTGVTALLSWTTYIRLIRTDRDALRRVDARLPSSSTERSVITGDTGELRAAHDARRLPGDAQ
jgi:hypothetical protein